MVIHLVVDHNGAPALDRGDILGRELYHGSLIHAVHHPHLAKLHLHLKRLIAHCKILLSQQIAGCSNPPARLHLHPRHPIFHIEQKNQRPALTRMTAKSNDPIALDPEPRLDARWINCVPTSLKSNASSLGLL